MIKVHRRLTLLETTPELLNELVLRGALADVEHIQLGPGLLLVEDEQAEPLLERLLELGYVPGVQSR